MIALEDIGFFARYNFDHRIESSKKNYHVASDLVDWEYLVSTFRKVTGQKAEVIYKTFDDWASYFTNTDRPVAVERREGDGYGSLTWAENFGRWWDMYRADVIKKDMDLVKRINPNVITLEK